MPGKVDLPHSLRDFQNIKRSSDFNTEHKKSYQLGCNHSNLNSFSTCVEIHGLKFMTPMHYHKKTLTSVDLENDRS